MTNLFIKRTFSAALLFVLLTCGISYSADTGQELISKIDENSAYQFNDEIRKLRKELEDANSGISASMPSGAIILWYGTVATIPTGFVLCDGNNGTPNLTNRFIVCADADDSGTAKTTLTGAATQSGGSIAHIHTGSVASHTHQLTLSQRNKDETGTLEGHAVVNTATGGTAPAVTINTIDAPQPYYALCYIMKT